MLKITLALLSSSTDAACHWDVSDDRNNNGASDNCIRLYTDRQEKRHPTNTNTYKLTSKNMTESNLLTSRYVKSKITLCHFNRAAEYQCNFDNSIASIVKANMIKNSQEQAGMQTHSVQNDMALELKFVLHI